jgi:hypothetical protein
VLIILPVLTTFGFAAGADRSLAIISVGLDSVPLYTCVAADSAAAAAEATRIKQLLLQMQSAAVHPELLRLREENSTGVLFIDSSRVIVVKPENRTQNELSPLANAVIMRDWLVTHALRPPWDEEELLLRLLLGIVYPFSLIVMLRLTRLGIRKWERSWRAAALHWFILQAERRGVAASSTHGKRLVHLLLGLERLLFFTSAVVLISFAWFTLFPQTRPLASSLVVRVVGPALSLLGNTIHALILLAYIVVVLLLARWSDHHLSQQQKLPGVPEFLRDPLIYFPLRLAIWIIALFLALFPFPGAPRMFALALLFIALLTGLLALRPIIEEISAGIWIGRHYQLNPGDTFMIGKQKYTLVSFHLLHLLAECNEERRFIPYSKILKSEIILPGKTGSRHAR